MIGYYHASKTYFTDKVFKPRLVLEARALGTQKLALAFWITLLTTTNLYNQNEERKHNHEEYLRSVV